MVSNDMDRMQRVGSGDGMDWSVPAVVELTFLSLTALVGIVWLVSLLWVPEPIDGQTWMGMGMLGLLMFGAPAGMVFALRRGGAEMVRAIIREMVR